MQQQQRQQSKYLSNCSWILFVCVQLSLAYLRLTLVCVSFENHFSLLAYFRNKQTNQKTTLWHKIKRNIFCLRKLLTSDCCPMCRQIEWMHILSHHLKVYPIVGCCCFFVWSVVIFWQNLNRRRWKQLVFDIEERSAPKNYAHLLNLMANSLKL